MVCCGDDVVRSIRFRLRAVLVALVEYRLVSSVARSVGRSGCWEMRVLEGCIIQDIVGRAAEVVGSRGVGVGDGVGGDFLWRTNRGGAGWAGCAQANALDLRGGDAGSACAGTMESVRW